MGSPVQSAPVRSYLCRFTLPDKENILISFVTF